MANQNNHKYPMYPWRKRGAVTLDYLNQIQYYYLNEIDLEVIRKWIPKAQIDCPYLDELEGILITKCAVSPDQTPNLSWQQILSILKQTEVPMPEPAKSEKSFIYDLIIEIDELIQQEGVLDKFRGHFDNFCLMAENYAAELDKYRLVAKNKFYEFADTNPDALKLLNGIDTKLLVEREELLGKVDSLYVKHCQDSPPENPTYVWHGSMIDYICKEDWAISAPVVYRPPLLKMPTNPVFWFLSEMDRYLSYDDPIRQPDNEELLICDFVRLAVIHDESSVYTRNTMVYKNKSYEGMFKRDDFTNDLWETYKNPKTEGFETTHERVLNQSLANVKVDLIQDETDTNKKPDDEGGGSIMQVRSNKQIWEDINTEYDITKRGFGKNINFVTDKFKRKIIFRDVEQAFVLASQGFSKPAIILTGGVIEELLRQYLKDKGIKLKDNRFVDYIKACEDNDLLKRGVSRLTDSVRDFRNLVHLSNEKTKRNSISKPKAKGAVASIFTIANDFQ